MKNYFLFGVGLLVSIYLIADLTVHLAHILL